MADSGGANGVAGDLFTVDPSIRRRRRRGAIVRFGLLAALMVAIAALVTLIITILNSSFGLVAVENSRPPSELVASLGYPQDSELEDLTKQDRKSVV